MRKTLARTRTPSLTRTSSSSGSSPTASTPKSNKSVNLALNDALSPAQLPLPRSTTASPAQQRNDGGNREEAPSEMDRSHESNETGASMDITDIHISPQRVDASDEGEEAESDNQHHSGEEKEGRLEYNEPTFSSEGDANSHAFSNRTVMPLSMPSPGIASIAASSPAPSLAMTPTPAFPRPRARFDLPKPTSELLATPAPKAMDGDEDLVTPHTRRRSFLLSVINSSARPRMKLGTPHPRQFVPETPSIAESPTQPSIESTPSSSGKSASISQAPFAGVTPRPRLPPARRLSHPLSQTVTASPGTSDSESVADVKPGRRAPLLQPWATPAQASPYDGTMDKASFISTASSHDLTTHHRVNTSFDPAMGFGAAANGHGVGRFNAGKLNNYLHGLNRRLQEENETLLSRVRRLEEEKKAEPLSMEPISAGSSRRSSGVHRRISTGGALDNVQEDVAEGWLEEKAQLEDMVEEFREEAEKLLVEKEEVEKELEKEREERERGELRWKTRLEEAEKEAVKIIENLGKNASDTEMKAAKAAEKAEQHHRELDRQLEEVKEELDLANERATKAERLLENGKDLGGALNEANERISRLMGDLRNANAQIEDLQEEVIRSDHRIDELEKDLREDKDIIAHLEEDLHTKVDALEEEQAKVEGLEAKVNSLEEEVASAKEYVDELEEAAVASAEHDRELAEAKATIEAMHIAEQQATDTIQNLERESQRSREAAAQAEEALEDAHAKLVDDGAEIASLKGKISSLERERDKYQKLADMPHEPSWKATSLGPTEEEMEALELELDDANREIGRLNALLSQSSAREAVDKAKDARIEMLEQEREELLERNKALRMTYNEMTTPHKYANNTTISPIHRHVLSMSIRAPRTPGAPLRDMSWLNNTMNDPTTSPLIAEIHRLQRELDVANESIDDKLDRLEDAGLGVVGLTKKLEDARAKISRLEDEIARLSRKEDRYSRRLARARCKNCNVKIDLPHLTADESSYDMSKDEIENDPPTPFTKNSEALKNHLQLANASLDQLRAEMEDLRADNQRLNVKIKETKQESRAGERAKSNVQTELDKAKRTIADLEHALSEERSRLRSIAAEQERAEKNKKHVLSDLRRAESDMDGVKQQLQRLKQENNELEKELRQNSTAEQKARLLETKVAENMDTISQLRQERSLLSKDHKDLQRRYSELSETVSRLREKHAAHSTSHDNWRHKLDLQVLEIEELKQALDDRSSQLKKAEREKDRIASEKDGVAKTVSGLEADLRRVRRDAEAFGRDLRMLRAEKEKLEGKLKEEVQKGERAKKQSQTQVKLLNEQLESQKQRATRALEVYENHVCAADGKQVSDLKMQHNKECKGLMVQIRYLKAKFVRESSFRSDLTYQKRYLLVILAQFEKSERTIFASIARIGFPVKPQTKRNRRSLKSVAHMLVFLNRIKRGSEQWQEQRASKAAISAALEDVRRRRALAASS
ncbi:hypothetical protein MD484_g1796, partial [Candolleomyces efflorescens]